MTRVKQKKVGAGATGLNLQHGWECLECGMRTGELPAFRLRAIMHTQPLSEFVSVDLV